MPGVLADAETAMVARLKAKFPTGMRAIEGLPDALDNGAIERWLTMAPGLFVAFMSADRIRNAPVRQLQVASNRKLIRGHKSAERRHKERMGSRADQERVGIVAACLPGAIAQVIQPVRMGDKGLDNRLERLMTPKRIARQHKVAPLNLLNAFQSVRRVNLCAGGKTNQPGLLHFFDCAIQRRHGARVALEEGETAQIGQKVKLAGVGHLSGLGIGDRKAYHTEHAFAEDFAFAEVGFVQVFIPKLLRQFHGVFLGQLIRR